MGTSCWYWCVKWSCVGESAHNISDIPRFVSPLHYLHSLGLLGDWQAGRLSNQNVPATELDQSGRRGAGFSRKWFTSLSWLCVYWCQHHTNREFFILTERTLFSLKTDCSCVTTSLHFRLGDLLWSCTLSICMFIVIPTRQTMFRNKKRQGIILQQRISDHVLAITTSPDL